MGLKVALDDFGSGQSSLSYVHQLSLDKIKIDRGFIRNIATQENARNIVKTVIDLCRNLKFDCVVEGVETAEQVEIIGRLGCSTMQGYFFAKPMPQSEVETFIANHYRMPDNLTNGRRGRVRCDQRLMSQRRCRPVQLDAAHAT